MRALLRPLFSGSKRAQPATVLAARHKRALIVYLTSLSAWAQAATVVAGITDERAALPSVRLFGVVTDSHSGGGHGR